MQLPYKSCKKIKTQKDLSHTQNKRWKNRKDCQLQIDYINIFHIYYECNKSVRAEELDLLISNLSEQMTKTDAAWQRTSI